MLLEEFMDARSLHMTAFLTHLFYSTMLNMLEPLDYVMRQSEPWPHLHRHLQQQELAHAGGWAVVNMLGIVNYTASHIGSSRAELGALGGISVSWHTQSPIIDELDVSCLY